MNRRIKEETRVLGGGRDGGRGIFISFIRVVRVGEGAGSKGDKEEE